MQSYCKKNKAQKNLSFFTFLYIMPQLTGCIKRHAHAQRPIHAHTTDGAHTRNGRCTTENMSEKHAKTVTQDGTRTHVTPQKVIFGTLLAICIASENGNRRHHAEENKNIKLKNIKNYEH